MPKPKRVVITGYGAICSLGESSQKIWEAILGYEVGYCKEVHPNPEVKAKFFGNINYPLNTAQFSKVLLKNLPRFARLGLIAADEAVNMAFGTKEIFHRSYETHACGVIFGTGWGGQDSTIENHETYDAEDLAAPNTNLLSMYGVGSAAISMNWGLRGYQNTPIAACATGSIAIGDAYERIKGGKAKMMLAGGGESIRGAFNVWSVDVLGALSKESDHVRKACCPFSLDRSGFVMSEGAAVLCLEEYDSAKARGATVIAELAGYGSFSDAFDITSPAPDMQGRTASISHALEEAGISPNDIDYVNAHGTSTPLNDVNETQCLKTCFGRRAYEIPTSSTKSYTGHLIAAAGALESMFCLKSIETLVIPATMHLDRQDPECDLDYVPHEHRRVEKLDVALNVNYGFGGTNSALVFRRAQ